MGERKIIGQDTLLNYIDNLKEMPQSVFILGQRGGGKKLLSQYLADKFNIPLNIVPGDVNHIRELKETFLTTNTPFCACIDYDTMSVSSQNALLKLYEEPTDNAHFILTTVKTESDILPTLYSRSLVLRMFRLKKDILKDVVNDNFLVAVCETLGEIEKISQKDLENYKDFAIKVYNNITRVSGVNAFNISKYIDLKDEGEGIPLETFFKIMLEIFLRQMLDSSHQRTTQINFERILVTTNSLKELNTINGVRKDSLFDEWILCIRELGDTEDECSRDGL